MPPMPTPNGSPAPAVRVSDVTYTYRGRPAPTLESVSCVINPGDRVGLLGPNGSGKTTLIKLMLGVLTPDRGEITVDGLPPRVAARRGRIATVAQRCQAELGFPITVRQAVAMPLANRLPLWKRPDPNARAHIDRALAVTGAEAFADDPVGALSGGQLQRALIARALATEPAVLILDEPLIGVDPLGQEHFAKMIGAIHERELAERSHARDTPPDLAIIIVSHDLRSIAATCGRVLCLARTIHEHASTEGLTPEVLSEIFHHDVSGLSAHSQDCDCPAHSNS